jgi:hypothetical protein
MTMKQMEIPLSASTTTTYGFISQSLPTAQGEGFLLTMGGQIEVGDQTFIYDGAEEFGAVRQVAPGGRFEIGIYVENAGEFVVPLETIKSVHSRKVILDYSRLEARLQQAIDHAHDAEKPDA